MASSQPVVAPNDERSYAGVGRRIVARLADLIVTFSMLPIVGFTLRILRALRLWGANVQDASPEELWRALGPGPKALIFLAFVVSQGVIYSTVFESSAWQATPAKRWLNIYVTDDRGRRISLARSFGRWFSRWFLGWFAGTLISIPIMAFTSNRKALHDLAAGTIVVTGRPAPEGRLEPWIIAAAFLVPFVWILASFAATL